MTDCAQPWMLEWTGQREDVAVLVFKLRLTLSPVLRCPSSGI